MPAAINRSIPGGPCIPRQINFLGRLKNALLDPIHDDQSCKKGHAAASYRCDLHARSLNRLRPMKSTSIAISIILSMLLTGCATVLNGTQQEVTISVECRHMTIPAYCEASNSAGRWRFKAPGTIVVSKSRSDLRVTCQSGTFGAYSDSTASGPSAAVLGNIVAGGLLGAAVDYTTGAALNYPSKIVVPTPLCRLM